MANSSSWTLRETLIVAMLGTVFAVLYLGWVQVWLVAQAVFGSLTMDVVMGFWFIASIVAAAIVRKPGVALASEVLAAAVQILLGVPRACSCSSPASFRAPAQNSSSPRRAGAATTCRS